MTCLTFVPLLALLQAASPDENRLLLIGVVLLILLVSLLLIWRSGVFRNQPEDGDEAA
jgi:type II secretory pathway component PulM